MTRVTIDIEVVSKKFAKKSAGQNIFSSLAKCSFCSMPTLKRFYCMQNLKLNTWLTKTDQNLTHWSD